MKNTECKGCNYEAEYKEPWHWHDCGKVCDGCRHCPEKEVFEEIEKSESKPWDWREDLRQMDINTDDDAGMAQLRKLIIRVESEARSRGKREMAEEVYDWFRDGTEKGKSPSGKLLGLEIMKQYRNNFLQPQPISK